MLTVYILLYLYYYKFLVIIIYINNDKTTMTKKLIHKLTKLFFLLTYLINIILMRLLSTFYFCIVIKLINFY